MRIRWLLPFVPALLVTLAPSPGRAEPPRTTSAPDKRALALDLAHHGLDSYRAGRFEEAYQHFREAQQLFPAPTLLVHMARCQHRLGRQEEAKALYEEVLAAPLPVDAPAPFVEARADAEREIVAVKAAIAAKKKARENTTTPARQPGSILPGAIALGFGVVGLGVGTVTGALSMSQVSEIRARCRNNLCLTTDRAAAEDAQTLGNVSTAAFVVGGIAAAAGVVLLVLRPGGHTEASAGVVKDLRVSVGIGRADLTFQY